MIDDVRFKMYDFRDSHQLDFRYTMPHPESIMPKILGKTNQDINAAVEIWSFFKQSYPLYPK